MNNKSVPINPVTAKRIGRPIAISELSDLTVCTVLQIWQNRKGDRSFPAKDEIVPKPIAAFLRNVMLIEIFPESDFEFRIVGDAAVVAYGTNFQGLRKEQLNALEAGFGDVIGKVCESVCRRRAPIAVRGVVTRAESSADAHEGLFLPLGEAEKVGHILFVGSYKALDAPELIGI